INQMFRQPTTERRTDATVFLELASQQREAGVGLHPEDHIHHLDDLLTTQQLIQRPHSGQRHHGGLGIENE
ncbi:MAG: hypothetical protein ACK56F_23300, partial [bacterium]